MGGQTEGQGSTGKCNAPHVGERPCLSFAAYGVEFVVEILRCRAPLHRSTSDSHRHAPDVELYSSTALQSALHLYSSTALYTLHPLHPPSARGASCREWSERLEARGCRSTLRRMRAAKAARQATGIVATRSPLLQLCFADQKRPSFAFSPPKFSLLFFLYRRLQLPS